MSKKFAWLKFSKRFFKEHQHVILESVPNGEKYMLFYIKLMAESVGHEGRLRYSEEIPYNEHMLAAITGTDFDTVHAAMETLHRMKLLVIEEDQTIFLPEVPAMIGSEGESAAKMRAWREAKKQQRSQCDHNVTESDHNVTERIEVRDKNTLSNNTIDDNIHTAREGNGPTLAEVDAFITSKALMVKPVDFWKYYNQTGWPEDWKAKALTWNNYYKTSPQGQKERADEVANWLASNNIFKK